MRRGKRALYAVLTVLVTGVVLVGCGGDDDGGEASEELTPVTLQSKWVPQAQFAGYYAAVDQGFYEDEGLAVTIRAGGPDIVPEQVVLGGQAEFGIDWLDNLLATRDQGQDLVSTTFRLDEIRVLVVEGEQMVLEFGESEKVTGFGSSDRRHAVVGADPTCLLDLRFRFERLAPFAIPTLVGPPIDVAVVVNLLNELATAEMMARIACLNKTVMAHFEGAPYFLELTSHFVAICFRVLP